METRKLGRRGPDVSIVGLGTWQLGGDWGDVSESDAFAVLEAAVDDGVTLFDTADVYGDGRSESLIGAFRAQHPDVPLTVATKIGRRVDQVPANYTLDNFVAWTDRSRRNLRVDTLDLVQLHCPPTAVFEDDRVYDALDALVERGAIAAYGVSVEETAQALTAMERPNLATVQIIFNAFRFKPLDAVLPTAAEKGVGILARVPLASGLLSGTYTTETTFAATDHRNYNRHGEAFDQGETFSGVDFEAGVAAAQEFAAAVPEGVSVPQAALKWILEQRGVTAVIPGARNAEQAHSNAGAASVPDLGADFGAAVASIYDRYFREAVHPRW